MARTYALEDFEDHARQLPARERAYKLIRNATYTFVSQDRDEVTAPDASDLLRLGSWGPVGNYDTVWATMSSDGRTVIFKHGKEYESLIDVEEIFTIGAYASVQAVVTPFRHFRPPRWPRLEDTKIVAHEDATARADLAIKLVFLITGRVENITIDNKTDALILFNDLCNRMPNTAGDNAENKQLEPTSAAGPSSKKLGKRPVIESSSDEEYTEQYSRLSTCILPFSVTPC